MLVWRFWYSDDRRYCLYVNEKSPEWATFTNSLECIPCNRQIILGIDNLIVEVWKLSEVKIDAFIGFGLASDAYILLLSFFSLAFSVNSKPYIFINKIRIQINILLEFSYFDIMKIQWFRYFHCILKKGFSKVHPAVVWLF